MKYKYLFLLIFLTSLQYACNGSKNDKDSLNTTVQIDEKEFNFGTITESDSIEHVFIVKNTGEVPLKIISADASCGCTVPQFTKESIQPDSLARITVFFKPNKDAYGATEKSIVLKANTDSVFHVLYIKGNVIKSSDKI